jgi:hypothetical protein
MQKRRQGLLIQKGQKSLFEGVENVGSVNIVSQQERGILMVPNSFSQQGISEARNFIIAGITGTRLVGNNIRGNPFVTYGDLARHLGYEIESEHDGDRVGILAGAVSRMEHNLFKGPLISAVVVDRIYQRPGRGFWVLGQQFNLFPDKIIDPDGIDELMFWQEHLKASVKKYG